MLLHKINNVSWKGELLNFVMFPGVKQSQLILFHANSITAYNSKCYNEVLYPSSMICERCSKFNSLLCSNSVMTPPTTKTYL